MPKNRPTEEHKEYMKWYRQQQALIDHDKAKKPRSRSIKRKLPSLMHRLYREIGIVTYGMGNDRHRA